MKTAKLLKNKQSKVAKLVFNHKKITVILVVLVVIALSIALYAIVAANRSHNVSTTGSTPATVQEKAALAIASDPAGIQMTATDPDCDGSKLKQTTPYVCTSVGKDLNAVITAPATVSINGKAYIFTSWDGCSASNDDKKVCKIDVKKGRVKSINASFKATSPYSASSTLRIGCPAASKYIVAGPQSFAPNTPGQLVLYNSTKDFQQPTYAQFWLGNSCKEIPLTAALRATKQEGGPSQGFGLADSAFVTRTSERTTVPAGGHIYIAVVDTPTTNYQALGAVIRDDGTVMIEKAGLKKTLDPSGTNTDANAVWAFKGWVDSHTALFRIPWTISTNSSCYYFDFDANTYASADSNLCSW